MAPDTRAPSAFGKQQAVLTANGGELTPKDEINECQSAAL